jgi:hypothetical protein
VFCAPSNDDSCAIEIIQAAAELLFEVSEVYQTAITSCKPRVLRVPQEKIPGRANLAFVLDPFGHWSTAAVGKAGAVEAPTPVVIRLTAA